MDKALRIWMFVVLIAMFSLNVNAADISGKIVDASTGDGIENAYVKVEIDGSEYGTTTLSDGGFLFNAPDGRGNIIITHVAYQPFFQNVALSGNVNLRTINLQPKIYTVGEVQVVTDFERLTCEDLFFRSDAINDPGDYHYYTSETSRCADKGVCFNYFSCKSVDTFEGECEFLDERNSDVGFCVSHACDSDYLDCDGDSFGNDKNGCECRIDQNPDTYGCVNRQCSKISEESLSAPGWGVGFGGQPVQPSATAPATGGDSYELLNQGNLCPEFSCPAGYQCRNIDGKCVKPENYDKQRCRIVTDYDNIQDEKGISENPIKGVEFWRKDINHVVVFEDKFYGNECIENENELSAADVAARAREAYRNRENLRREARGKTGVSSMSVFEFLNEEREYELINALIETSKKAGIEIEVLTAVAFQENIGQWLYVSQLYGSGDLSRRGVVVPNELALDYFSVEADTLKREGFLRDDFDGFSSTSGAGGSFDNINFALEGLAATLLHRRSLFFEDLEGLGIDKNTLTKDQIVYWNYIYFNCGAGCGEDRLRRDGVEIPNLIGADSKYNTHRNSKLVLGTVYQIRSAGLFDPLNQVKVYYCENDELKFAVVNDKENLCSILKGGTELIDIDDIPELDLVDLEKPELQRDEEIVVTMTGSELVKNAICSALPEGLEFVEESTIVEPTGSIVKQITGFFSKITGKQISTTTDKRYTAKIITRAYHDLSNLPNPYLGIGFYSDDSSSRADRTAQARFLDKKVGSALLRSFGYTSDRLQQTISSAETQNEIVLNRGGGQYKHSIRILDRDNRPSKLKVVNTGRGFDFGISELEYESSDMPVPDYREFIRFILVSTEEDRYLSLSDGLYSVSAGNYLVPYPFNDRVIYTQLNEPGEEYKLGHYYEVANKQEKITYVVFDDKTISIPLLNPSESYFLLKDIPEGFEKIRKSYKYKGAYNVNYRIIALAEDYGDFKKGVYLAAEDYVVSMDNLYSLRRNSALRYLPAQPGNEIDYNEEFFDRIRDYIARKKREAKEASLLNFIIETGKETFDIYILEPSRYPVRRG